MDYLHYQVNDFLSDSSFQKSCLGTDATAVELWSVWLQKHPEKIDEYNYAKKLYFDLNGSITDEDFKRDFTYFNHQFQQHLAKDKVIVHPFVYRVRSIIPRMLLISGVAASLVIAILFFFRYKVNGAFTHDDLTATYITLEGQKRTITLPDGTQIILNGGSSLQISDGFNKSSRNVNLQGEGFFQVIHNEKLPFIVHTLKFNVRVLGTTFNVKAYTNDRVQEASLVKGSIKVTMMTLSQSKVMLVPHEKFVLNSVVNGSRSSTRIFHVASVVENVADHSLVETDWTKNRININDQCLEDIVVTLQRWYGIHIIIENPEVAKYRYTSTFENDDITNVLRILQLTNHFNYRKEGSSIIIY